MEYNSGKGIFSFYLRVSFGSHSGREAGVALTSETWAARRTMSARFVKLGGSMDKKHQNKSQSKATVKRSGLFGFFQYHYKWIAIVSGLVVSLTLSLRDHFHERAKDFTSSIEIAEDFGHVRELSDSTNGRLEVIERDIVELRKKADKPTIDSYSERNNDLELLLLFGQKELLAKSAALDRLTELLSEAERKEYKDKQTGLLFEIAALTDSPDLSKYEGKSIKEVMEAIQSTRRNAMRRIQSISERFDNLQKGIFQTFRERKKRYEHQERVYGFISYAIIALGVGLSLAAKVFEPDDKAIESPGTEVG